MNWKRRISIILIEVMLLPMLISLLPLNMVEAKSNSYLECNFGLLMTVEVGSKLDFADNCTYGTVNKRKKMSSLKKVKYSSSRKKVGAITSKGIFTAKKKGSTAIKIKYKGKTYNLQVKVVAKKYTKDKRIIEINKILSELKKKVKNEKSINRNNRLELLKKYYRVGDVVSDINGKEIANIFYDGEVKNRVVCPNYYLVYKESPFWNYCKKCNPISTKSSYAFKSTSIEASPEAVTINLSKPISQDQIFGLLAIKYGTGSDKIKDESSADIEVYVASEDGEGIYMYGKAIKNEQKITFDYFEKNGESITLSEGTYRLDSYWGWSEDKNFTVSIPAQYPSVVYNVVFVDQQEGKGTRTQYCGIASAACLEWWSYQNKKGASYIEQWNVVDPSNELCQKMRVRNNPDNPISASTVWGKIFGQNRIDVGSYKNNRNYYYKNGKVQMDELYKMYEKLKNGPLIVHRQDKNKNEYHYSVVYGYRGNSRELELSGFLVQEVCKAYKYYVPELGEYRTTLDKWCAYRATEGVYYYYYK